MASKRTADGKGQTVKVGNVVADHSTIAIGQNISIGMSRPIRAFIGVPPRPLVLVGREVQMDQLRTQLFHTSGDTRPSVFALDGRPGVGKTTLAAAIAHDQASLERFSGGVFWASIGQLADADEILSSWARACGIDVSGEERIEGKVTILQGILSGPVLLILDDVWPNTKAVADLLRQVSVLGSVCLITTRHEDIARVVAPGAGSKVTELDENAATSLITALCPTVAVGNRERLAHLAAAVGYLPLALALVGGYLASRVAFADEIDPAFDVLAQTETWLGLSDDEHTIALDEVIGRSIDALGYEAAAFIQLGAFAPKPAHFSRRAATQVCATEKSFVTRLVLCNLLEKLDEDLVTMHQTIQAVAEVRANRRSTLEAARLRHSSYYLDLMKESADNWLALQREWPQISHAWGWISVSEANANIIVSYVDAAWAFQSRYGLQHEQLAWCERALPLATRPVDRGNLLNQMGVIHASFGENMLAVQCYGEALAIRKAIGFNEGIEATLNNLGLLAANVGNYPLAFDYYNEALTISRKCEFKHGEATALNNIASVYYSQGDHHQALDYYAQAQAVLPEITDQGLEARILSNMGNCYRAIGQPGSAVRCWNEALLISCRIGDRSMEATALGNIAAEYLRRGEYEQAIGNLNSARSIHHELGNLAGEALALQNLASCYATLGEVAQALELQEQALSMRRAIGDIAGQANSLNSIGKYQSDLGDEAKAVRYYEEALRLEHQIGDQSGETINLLNLGKSHGTLGKLKEAKRYFEQALELARKTGERRAEAIALNGLGKYHYDKGDYSQARELYEQGLAISREIEDGATECLLLFQVGSAYVGQDAFDEARPYFRQALTLARRLRLALLEEQANLGLEIVIQRRRDSNSSLGRLAE